MATADLSFYRSKVAAPVVLTDASASHATPEIVPLPGVKSSAIAGSTASAKAQPPALKFASSKG
ncbi:MAG: hypothetical protein U0894_17280 [Pirellulales bacterium]